LALTAFTDGEIKVFDRENECVSSVYVPPRTVVLDNEVAESEIEGLSRFSMATLMSKMSKKMIQLPLSFAAVKISKVTEIKIRSVPLRIGANIKQIISPPLLPCQTVHSVHL
jgi:hypothetical protein